MPATSERLRKFDTTVPHSARLWNYLLGGKDCFAADRAAAEEILVLMPDLVRSARFTRQFLGRVVRYLTMECGIRQFLDIGAGLPMAENTHEVAQAIAADSRVVYVDNDPMVVAHGRAHLTSTPAGRTDYVNADLRDVERIVPAAARTLDFRQPIAVMLLGVVNFVVDDTEARALLRRLVDAIPTGSYLVVSHPTHEVNAQSVERAIQMWNGSGAAPMTARSPREITRFFHNLELVEPGIVTCSRWRPDGNDTSPCSEYCGVGFKH